MSEQVCPRCGGGILSKYCDHCGSLPFATNVKTGQPVRVDRSGHPDGAQA